MSHCVHPQAIQHGNSSEKLAKTTAKGLSLILTYIYRHFPLASCGYIIMRQTTVVVVAMIV